MYDVRDRVKEEEQMSIELVLAAAAGNVQNVRELLDAGADINFADGHGNTPLLHACTGGHVEVVELLLERDADWKCGNLRGTTTVMKLLVDGFVRYEAKENDLILESLKRCAKF